MSQVFYTRSQNDKDLHRILALQQKNLLKELTEDEIASQGFVTVQHSFDDLKKMNDIEPHVIGKVNDHVIAYCLSMTSASARDIPILIPMFEVFNSIILGDKAVSQYNYIVVGQVCIDKAHRGKGVFDGCYQAYKSAFEKKYDFAITEIATRNQRSMNAHSRVGFREIHRYTASDGVEWSIVIWEWD
jgi:hypothetical protein